MKRSESITNIAKALNGLQKNVLKATKSRKNPFYKSEYADLEEVWDCIRKPFTENGLSVTQLVGSDPNGKPYLTTILFHVSGEYIEETVMLPIEKSGSQAVGSCITYFKRYCLSALTGVSDIDDDAEKATKRAEAGVDTKNQDNTPLNGDKAATDASGNKEKSTYHLSSAQIKRLYAKAYSNNWPTNYVDAALKVEFKKTASDLSYAQYNSACKFFDDNSFENIHAPSKELYKDHLEQAGENVQQAKVVKKENYKNYAPGAPSFDANEEIPF